MNDWERRGRQDVILNVTLLTNTRPASATDKFEDAVDYRALNKHILAHVEDSKYHLVETLAEKVAEICLSDSRVMQATVRVEKPGALRFADSVGVEITRHRAG